MPLVDYTCDCLRKAGFKVIHKKPFSRGTYIWLAEGFKIHMYNDKAQTFIRGEKTYKHMVVYRKRLKIILGESTTFYFE